ncbi:hypothetical protein CCR85_08760 [Rhodothalassium salexigens]|nr:hypothetical protein [Rhodothalassium salexigens]
MRTSLKSWSKTGRRPAAQGHSASREPAQRPAGRARQARQGGRHAQPTIKPITKEPITEDRGETMKLFVRLALAALLVVAAVAGTAVYVIRDSLPPHEGTLDLDGLEGAVTVTRDRWGVPHIEAGSLHDLYFALGVVHAQDRLWQVDVHRRIASGRLAELFGPAALSTDKFLRTLGFRHRAEAALSGLSAQTRAVLDAYAAGVNAYADQAPHLLPPEYQILRADYDPIDAADTLAWLKVMSLDLSRNYGLELDRLALLGRLTPEQVTAFLPAYPGDDRPPLPDLAALYDGAALARLDSSETAPPPPDAGSNNWVVDGSRTASGKPILANDPHLGLNTPSLWYLAHLRLTGADGTVKNGVGVTMPGVPAIILGRNDRLAWGFTNTGPDTQDLYLEKLVDEGTYATPDGQATFGVREEIIAVDGAEPVSLRVRETRHGPVISDVLPRAAETLPEGHVLSLRWTALAADDSSGEIAHRMLEVTDFDSFRRVMDAYVTPQQNIVYADVDGNIGYYAPARVPVRPDSDETHGMVPKPGWKPGFDWSGTIPYDELPRAYNPQDGMIVTANSKVVGPDYPHHLTWRWSEPYRTDRITELLTRRRDHTLDSMAAIQLDLHSPVADALLGRMLTLASEGKAGHDDVRTMLTAWDHDMDVGRPAPLLFAAWHRALARAVYADELGDRFDEFFGHKTRFLATVLAEDAGADARAWCDDVTTPDATETCAERVALALDDAMATLSARLGGDWRGWAWGDVHRVIQEHRPFSNVAPLKDWFELSAPIGGGSYTVNVASGTFRGPEPHANRAGAGYRGLFDLAMLDRSRYVIATGQSGHFLSPHYDDLFELWRDGRYIQIPARIPEGPDAKRLVLRPAGDPAD